MMIVVTLLKLCEYKSALCENVRRTKGAQTVCMHTCCVTYEY